MAAPLHGTLASGACTRKSQITWGQSPTRAALVAPSQMLYPLRMVDAPGATHADAPNPVTRDETSATSTRGIQSRSGSWRGLGSLPGWTLTGLLASVVGLLAALTRFPRL